MAICLCVILWCTGACNGPGCAPATKSVIYLSGSQVVWVGTQLSYIYAANNSSPGPDGCCGRTQRLSLDVMGWWKKEHLNNSSLLNSQYMWNEKTPLLYLKTYILLIGISSFGSHLFYFIYEFWSLDNFLITFVDWICMNDTIYKEAYSKQNCMSEVWKQNSWGLRNANSCHAICWSHEETQRIGGGEERKSPPLIQRN